jgi:hypothetical protein
MLLRLLETLSARNFWGVTNGDFRHDLSFNLVVRVLEHRSGWPRRKMSAGIDPLRKIDILGDSMNNTLRQWPVVKEDLLAGGGVPRKGAVWQKYA